MTGERSRVHAVVAGIGRLWAPLISALMHVVWVYGAALGSPALERKPLVEFVQIEWVEAERKIVAPVPATSHMLSQPRPAPIQRGVRRTGRAAVGAPRAAPHAVTVTEPPQPPAAARDDLVSAPLILDARAVRMPVRADDVLSPARVAAATFSSTLVDAPAPAAIETDQGKAERVSRALNEELRAAAAEIRHLSRRPPPKLERLHDGSYRWEGPLFNALAHAAEIHTSPNDSGSYSKPKRYDKTSQQPGCGPACTVLSRDDESKLGAANSSGLFPRGKVGPACHVSVGGLVIRERLTSPREMRR